MHSLLPTSLLLLVFSCSTDAFAKDKPAVPCKTYFTVVSRDELNNVKQGLSADNAKWINERLAKKYPGICYSLPSEKTTVMFLITISIATYHGTRTVSYTDTAPVTGTITDENGNVSTIRGTQTTTSTSTVPNTFDYPVLSLSIESGSGNRWQVRHNVERRGICSTIYGIRLHCKIVHYVLEDAIQWVADGGLTDPRQSVAPSDQK